MSITTSQHVALKNINAARQVSLSVDLKMPKESWKKEKVVEERSMNIVACNKRNTKRERKNVCMVVVRWDDTIS